MLPSYKHQETARDLLSRYEQYALIMEQGTGKSRPVLEDWLNKVQAGLADDLVVLAPKGCYMNWIGTPDEPGELDKWVPEDFNYYGAAWKSGASASYMQRLRDLLHAKGPRFLVMNIEALNRPSLARQYLLNFIGDRKVIGVIDESTTIAHEDASRTTFILEEAWRFKYRRILSGLVAPESPMDLYSQYRFLDWSIIGQKNFWTFKTRYAIMEKVDFRPAHLRGQPSKNGKPFKEASVVVGFRNMEELKQKIMMRSYRVTKDEVLDLLPKIYKFWDVDLTEEQDRIYRQMRDAAMAQLTELSYATAKMKLDQLGKMQHILCGHIRNEDGTLHDIPENRTGAVIEILHEHAGKAIIWAPYPQALRKIAKRLLEEFGEDSTVCYWGETRLEERLIARNRIQNDDKCRFIVSNQSVGKFGNTWTSCNLVIYYANSFDNEDRQQSEDRAHRIGQTKYVTYVDLRARGTIDDRLIQVLRKKISMASTLQGDVFKQWLI